MLGYVLAGLFIAAIGYLVYSSKKTGAEEESGGVEGSGPPTLPEPPTQVEPTKIENLDLGEGVLTALEKNKIETVSELQEYSDDFTEIYGIGPKRAEEIEETLNQQ